MSCSNCYNGCTEIVSDQCVKYTGVDVPILGIKTGDSLSYVEQALIGFLVSTLNGSGIKLDINPQIICEIVNKNLVECEDLTLINVIQALIKAICELDERLTTLEGEFAALEGAYTVDCLDGVSSTSGTHAILQATITKLCDHIVDFEAFVLDVETNYVKKSELCALVAACAPSPGATQYKDRMVPYAVVEYYGSLTNFDLTGAGIPANGFEDIYLCNGNNGTPDKRGRIPVGAIQGVPGGALNPAVDPAIAGNPNYALNGTTGANTITLTPAQIPAHTHTATVTITDPGHTHFIANPGDTSTLLDSTHSAARGHSTGGNLGYDLVNTTGTTATVGLTDNKTTGLKGSGPDQNVSVVNASVGGGQSHSNIPPVLACYYIMYIP
jgi:microcystin-dependent protein